MTHPWSREGNHQVVGVTGPDVGDRRVRLERTALLCTADVATEGATGLIYMSARMTFRRKLEDDLALIPLAYWMTITTGSRKSTAPWDLPATTGGEGHYGCFMCLRLEPQDIDVPALYFELSDAWLSRTSSATRRAASVGSSCSQTRRTRHPASLRRRSVSASRSRVRRTFSAQNSALVTATVW